MTSNVALRYVGFIQLFIGMEHSYIECCVVRLDLRMEPNKTCV